MVSGSISRPRPLSELEPDDLYPSGSLAWSNYYTPTHKRAERGNKVKRCEYPSDNHSDDIVDVYHGSTTPTHLCGYHTTWNLNEVLKAIRAKAAE